MSLSNNKQNAPPNMPQDFPVVGIGASAGGLEAFKKFIENIDENSGMAYVLVQHLAPTHESVLPEILSCSTSIPVHEITNDINLAPDHIYIISENKIVTAMDGVLKVSSRDQKKNQNRSIDIFFKSLAEVHQAYAIAAVFSGTGFDGTEGLKAVKEKGGVTYAQSLETAAFDAMPFNAINSGSVDFIMKPEEIPKHLLNVKKTCQSSEANSGEIKLKKEEQEVLRQILRILLLRSGNDFSNYKESTLRSIMARRMVITKKGKPEEYLDFLKSNVIEQDALFNDMLITVNDELLDQQEQLITARNNAEAIVETIREPLAILDSELKVKKANKAFYQYFRTTEKETEGKLIFELNNGQWDRPELRTLLEKLIQYDTKIEDFEITGDFPVIGQHSILINARQIINENPSEDLILMAFEDVTEFKLVNILRESEERFRAMTDTAPFLLWISEPDGKVQFFNRSWLEYTGRDMDQEKGMGWTMGIFEADRDKVLNEFHKRFNAREEINIEFRLRRNDGENRWVYLKGVPRYDLRRDFLGYVGGCTDIHEQKIFSSALEEKVENRTRQLKESQNFLESILSMTLSVIYIYDFEKEKIVFVNSKVEHSTGYTPEEIMNAPKDIFTPLIHIDDRDHVNNQRQKILKLPDGKMVTMEYRLQHRKGRWTYKFCQGLVFKRDKKGKVVQYIGVATNVSELKNANMQLKEQNRELERNNIELASFSSIASHDLNEPLRKIQLFLKLVLEKDKDQISKASQKYMERVIVSANKMQQLIDDLISYSRTSFQKVRFTSTDLNKLMKAVLEDLKENIVDNQAQVSVGPLPTVPVIPSQFRQLFVNLIGNALKYKRTTPVIKITSENADPNEISKLEANQDKNFYKIIVSDNGIGFPQVYSQKIFEPFQRLHGKDEYSGTGIGLAICKKIITNHSGYIMAESKEGEGSTFKIFVPYKKKIN